MLFCFSVPSSPCLNIWGMRQHVYLFLILWRFKSCPSLSSDAHVFLSVSSPNHFFFLSILTNAWVCLYRPISFYLPIYLSLSNNQTFLFYHQSLYFSNMYPLNYRTFCFLSAASSNAVSYSLGLGCWVQSSGVLEVLLIWRYGVRVPRKGDGS